MSRSQVSRAPHRGAPVLVLAGIGVAAAVLALSLPAGGETAQAQNAGPCAYAHSGPGKLNQAQAREAILCLVNKKRAKHGSGPLELHGDLSSAAQSHTSHMLARRCFDHDCPGEPTIEVRIRNAGYVAGANGWGVGENIAAGNGKRGSPAHIVQKWMQSHPHRVTLLKGDFEHLGVGMGHGTPWKPKSGGATYTTDFGHING